MATAILRRDCRFWPERHLPRWLIRQDLHPNYGECEPADSPDGTPQNVQTLGLRLQPRGYQAILLISPEYGCVQGKPRQDDTANPPG